jgi:hypothetical protein
MSLLHGFYLMNDSIELFFINQLVFCSKVIESVTHIVNGNQPAFE